MKLRAYIEDIENKKVENKLLRFAVLVMAVSSVVSAMFSYNALQYQKVIILPPVVDRRIEITGNDANDDYFKLYGKYIINLLMCYVPANYGDQAKDLLSLCVPEFYPSMENRLKEIEVGVRKLDISSVFYPYKIDIDRKKFTIRIEGNREQHARGELVGNEKKSFIITYKIEDGRLRINDLAEEVKK